MYKQRFKNNYIRNLALLFVILTLTVACNPTRLLTDDEYLLQKNKLVIDSKQIEKRQLEGYYRQKPNKRTFFLVKLPLATYNFSKTGRSRKWKDWVGRVMGEAPVIFDSTLAENTVNQFDRYLKNQAYYNADISYKASLKNKKAKVTYFVKPNEPIIIKSVDFRIEDENIAKLILSDTSKSELRVNELFTLESLKNERKRIFEQMRNNGYFYFNEDNTNYKVDTLNLKAKIRVVVGKHIVYDSLNNPIYSNHRKYYIDKVFIHPDFNPSLSMEDWDSYSQTFDTTNYNNFGFIYTKGKNIRPKVVLKANSIYPNSRYKYSNVMSTKKYLNSLNLFRLNTVNFTPVKEKDSLLNCNIYLTPSTYQKYSVNFETTNSQGNYGLGGYLNYHHKNLFKGAEIFNVKLSGSIQRITDDVSEDGVVTHGFNIVDYGIVTSLETPSFILPVRMERFYKKYNPKTTFSILYNKQIKPNLYSRSIYGISMGYKWFPNKFITYLVNPFDFAAVRIEEKYDSFFSRIKGTYLENNFKDYLIAGGNVSFIFKEKTKVDKFSYNYLRWNVGFAGNALNFFYRNVLKADTSGIGHYEILNLQFAQYLQTDIDYRFYVQLVKNQSVATRIFAGVVTPLKNGNTKAIPFVRQYYGGGAQGMRAWHMYSLGPGAFAASDSTNSFQTGDIKLETNLEYRFSMSHTWKGALFVDIGNIWAISPDDERVGVSFKYNEFYKQFAIGTGFGLRYDLKYAIIRVDWGIKVKDPSVKGRDSWVLFNRPFKISRDLNWHFAIGYPF